MGLRGQSLVVYICLLNLQPYKPLLVDLVLCFLTKGSVQKCHHLLAELSPVKDKDSCKCDSFLQPNVFQMFVHLFLEFFEIAKQTGKLGISNT